MVVSCPEPMLTGSGLLYVSVASAMALAASRTKRNSREAAPVHETCRCEPRGVPSLDHLANQGGYWLVKVISLTSPKAANTVWEWMLPTTFKPHYVLMEDKLDVMDALLAAAKKVDRILIASDPDREGEAIAWHLTIVLADTGIKRMVFNEIKKARLQKALKEVRDVDINLFHSQEARRICWTVSWAFSASPIPNQFLWSSFVEPDQMFSRMSDSHDH